MERPTSVGRPPRVHRLNFYFTFIPALASLLMACFANCRYESNAATTATSVVASLNHKELGRSQVPTLEVGDVIEADIWKSKLGGGKVR